MPDVPVGDQGWARGLTALCLQTQISAVFGILPNTSAKLHFAMQLVTSGMQMGETALARGAWELVLPKSMINLNAVSWSSLAKQVEILSNILAMQT